jgi:hypothetical protein
MRFAIKRGSKLISLYFSLADDEVTIVKTFIEKIDVTKGEVCIKIIFFYPNCLPSQLYFFAVDLDTNAITS